MAKRQPNEQREQKPNLFGLFRVTSEEEVFNTQLITILTVGIYRTHLYNMRNPLSHSNARITSRDSFVIIDICSIDMPAAFIIFADTRIVERCSSN